jgi:hypothetical protein
MQIKEIRTSTVCYNCDMNIRINCPLLGYGIENTMRSLNGRSRQVSAATNTRRINGGIVKKSVVSSEVIKGEFFLQSHFICNLY